MTGAIIGLALGGVELFLLKYLIDGILGGELRWWLVPLKLLALVAFLVPCGLLVPKQLHFAGIAAAAVLIIGAVAIFLRRTRLNRNGSDSK